jgi:hypothetical protein
MAETPPIVCTLSARELNDREGAWKKNLTQSPSRATLERAKLSNSAQESDSKFGVLDKT